ncbi:MAG: putative methyltransferase-domain-containing protein [Lentinula lateritia]|uniref:Methyltransferase-domain-containing protein n=1 Tax=Lentinula lateritia TaxID=40482 RepID=A0ABQ8VX16_9AGAR|nr:MAG: putative methyltransferase-domain-containing protein [Lentinula lateritia]KAJ4500927.1 putative methyltransferase-domain-containing protein [Lentinula lateritia]
MLDSNPNFNFPKYLDIQPSTFSVAKDSGTLSSIYGHESQKQAIETYGIAGRVWEAAYILSIYLNPPSNLIFNTAFLCEEKRKSIRIIELGSGSGMVGINVALSLKLQLGDRLVLTDLSEVCPLLESNLNAGCKDPNLRDLIYVRPLAWGNSEHANRIRSELVADQRPQCAPLSRILCSDLVYFPELLAPLLRTLIDLTSCPLASPQLEVLISYKIRSLPKEAPFWAAFGLWFTYEPVLVREQLPDSSLSSWQRFGSTFEGPMFIFIARRRPESLEWIVPLEDSNLLAGFGAYGTMHPKVDDTFENILFMSLGDTTE